MSESVPNRAGHEKRSDLYGPLDIANQWFDVMSAHNARMDEPKPRTAQEAMDIVGGYKSQDEDMDTCHQCGTKSHYVSGDTGLCPNCDPSQNPNLRED